MLIQTHILLAVISLSLSFLLRELVYEGPSFDLSDLLIFTTIHTWLLGVVGLGYSICGGIWARLSMILFYVLNGVGFYYLYSKVDSDDEVYSWGLGKQAIDATFPAVPMLFSFLILAQSVRQIMKGQRRPEFTEFRDEENPVDRTFYNNLPAVTLIKKVKNLDCAYCSKSFKQGHVARLIPPCCHTIHSKCSVEYFENSTSMNCPKCLTHITWKDISKFKGKTSEENLKRIKRVAKAT